MNDKPLPCPFCGQVPVFVDKLEGLRDEPERIYYIFCPDGHAKFGARLSDIEESQAYQATLADGNGWKNRKHYWKYAIPKLMVQWNKRFFGG